MSSEYHDFDLILESVGPFGRYQLITSLLLFIPAGITGIVALGSVFLAPVPKHRCLVSICEYQNDTSYEQTFTNFSIPEKEQCTGFAISDNSSSCSSDSFDRLNMDKCSEWIYDDTHYISSVTIEFGLVCDSSYLHPLLQSIFFAGVLTGTIVFGQLANAAGRKFALMVSLLLMTAAPIAASFANSYEVYAATQFVIALGQTGTFQSAFLLCVEIVGKKRRVLVGVVIEYFFVVGEVVLTGLALWLHNWRSLSIAMAVPSVICLGYSYFLLPESPRWLLRTNRLERAEREIAKIARWNGRKWLNGSLDGFKETAAVNDNTAEKQETIMDVVRSRPMVTRALNLYYAWAVVAMSYYGLSLNAHSMAGKGGNPYLDFLLAALVELPGYTLSYIGMEKLGRRISLSSSLLLGGLSCLVCAFEPPWPWLRLTAFLLGKFGVTAAFGTIFLYTSELYPTSVRALGLGMSSMCGRVGAVLSPFVGASASVASWLPMAIFATLAISSGTLVLLLLPETLGTNLPDTIAQAEKFGKKRKEEEEVVIESTNL